MFLLRELLFYTTGNSMLIDKLCSYNMRWSRFKALVRQTNAELRKEISQQTRQAFARPMNWDVLEKSITINKKIQTWGDFSLYHKRILTYVHSLTHSLNRSCTDSLGSRRVLMQQQCMQQAEEGPVDGGH